MTKISKVLWFSRHTMTDAQIGALNSKLGCIDVTQVSATFQNVHVPFSGTENGIAKDFPPFKELVKGFDVIGIVLPIHLEKQVLDITGKPVIKALSDRVLITEEGEEDKVDFIFKGWQRLIEIKLVTEPFTEPF